MPKYGGGDYFAHGSFPEVGQKQKTEKKAEKRPKKSDFFLKKIKFTNFFFFFSYIF